MQRIEYADEPFVGHGDRGALLTEFRVLTARLVKADLMTAASATRLARNVARASKLVDAERGRFAELLSDLIVALETNALEHGQQVFRVSQARIALHLASIAAPLATSSDRSRTERDLRRLFRFAALRFGDLVVAPSSRVSFGGERRLRAVVVDLPRAYAFIGSRQPVASFINGPRSSGAVRSH